MKEFFFRYREVFSLISKGFLILGVKLTLKISAPNYFYML